MEDFETTGEVISRHVVPLDEPVPFPIGTRVRVTIRVDADKLRDETEGSVIEPTLSSE
jgi:hypothetical protein